MWSPKFILKTVSSFISVSLACGSTSSENCTYLMQSATDTLTDNHCTYTICRCNSNICRIRLDFTVRSYISKICLANALTYLFPQDFWYSWPIWRNYFWRRCNYSNWRFHRRLPHWSVQCEFTWKQRITYYLWLQYWTTQWRWWCYINEIIW